MVGPLVIFVVFMDAPIRFFTGYRTERRLYPDVKFHQVPKNTGYRFAPDTGYLFIKRLINRCAYLLDGMHLKIGKV